MLFKLFDNKRTIDFYLVDAFEISHFMPFYKRLGQEGYDVKFVAEPCKRNTAKNWFDYNTAIKILDNEGVDYIKRARKKANITFTTQDAYLLSKYHKNTKKINLSYGFSFKKDYFPNSKRTIVGFDYRFVHGEFQKNILSNYFDINRILEVGYPRYHNTLNIKIDRIKLLSELGITTNKPIVIYFPTWDEDSTIQLFGDTIKRLKEKYYVITKPHHCTTMDKNPNDYLKIKEISDYVLDNLYDLKKASMIADVCIADAKSGISLEIAYINDNIPILLLINSENKKNDYYKEMWEYFNVIDNPKDLSQTIDSVILNDTYRDKRNCIIEKCYGLKNYNYMDDVVRLINSIV